MSKQKANHSFFSAYQAVRKGEAPKRRAKDRSVPTHPTIPCPEVKESVVLQQVQLWLKRHRICADRMNVGAGHLEGTDRFHTYGIPGAGDIMAILPGGIHCEIECKAGAGGRWSEDQQKRCKKVLDAGGIYVIIHGIPELADWYENFVVHKRKRVLFSGGQK